MTSPSPAAHHGGPSGSWATRDFSASLTAFLDQKLTAYVLAPTIALFLWLLVTYHTSPLKRFPGPFLARYTNLYRVWKVYKGDFARTVQKLHEKYGPVVRLGPNMLDIDIPELCRVIYGTDGWAKSNMYQINTPMVNGQILHNMFSQPDPGLHMKARRPVVRHFSVSAVQALEPQIDLAVTEFLNTLQRRFVDTEKSVDIVDWLSYFAWDFMGMATMSSKYGFMEKGGDIDNVLANNVGLETYFAHASQMPWVDWLLDKNPIVHLGPAGVPTIVRFAGEKMAARAMGQDKNYNPERPDFMQYFMESKKTHPDLVDDGAVVGYMLLNLIAGADTVATILHGLFYYILKNPAMHARLRDEVRAAFQPFQVAPYSQARALPYLDAVVRETLRYHPPICFALERVVPATGLPLPDGSVVPGGQIVGINAWVVQRNKGVYGEDADEFKPERWLQREGEGDEEYKERMRKWSEAMLVFGGGSRICLGRHLGLMEIYKAVASVFATFDIELENPEKDWWIQLRWFARSKGVICKLRPRGK